MCIRDRLKHLKQLHPNLNTHLVQAVPCYVPTIARKGWIQGLITTSAAIARQRPKRSKEGREKENLTTRSKNVPNLFSSSILLLLLLLLLLIPRDSHVYDTFHCYKVRTYAYLVVVRSSRDFRYRVVTGMKKELLYFYTCVPTCTKLRQVNACMVSIDRSDE